MIRETYGTLLEGVRVVDHLIHEDGRGYFTELWKTTYDGMRGQFRQLNCAKSKKNVLRGLHYQDQTKFVMPITGRIFDVAIDTMTGKWFGVELDSTCGLFIPAQYAHGYLVLSDEAIVQYIVDKPYMKELEQNHRYDSFGIDWPLDGLPILSAKDA